MDLESAKKVPLNRITHSVRASQAVLQYGVGAMIDFPNQTLMTAAPEYWQEQVVQINVLIFYVGTSRARIKLEITAILSDDDCKEILTSVLNYQGKIRRAKKDFAGALNAIGCLET